MAENAAFGAKSSSVTDISETLISKSHPLLSRLSAFYQKVTKSRFIIGALFHKCELFVPFNTNNLY